MFYSETRAAKVCLPFVGHLMRNRKDMNRISFLNRGYAFKGLLAVFIEWACFRNDCFASYQLMVKECALSSDQNAHISTKTCKIQRFFMHGSRKFSRGRGLTENLNMAKINNLAIPGGSGPPVPLFGSTHVFFTCKN